MSRYVYGPVPSRRLGRSLGVSLVPYKTCSYSCCYCQLGRTTCQTMERRRYFPPDEVLGEVEGALAASESLDYVSFIGDGEPTLSCDLGLLVDRTRGSFNVPVAVVTNGSLLDDPTVREELMAADRVLPTLATGDCDIWRRLHRPHRGLDFRAIVEGLFEFSDEFDGELWLEVMLVHGLNDSDEALSGLRQVIDVIGPDRIDVLVPTRPPTEDWVTVPGPDRVLRAWEVLGPCDVHVGEPEGDFDIHGYGSAGEALVSIGSRHLLREEAGERICRDLDEPDALEELLECGDLVRIAFNGVTFLLPRQLARGRGGVDIREEESHGEH